MAQRVVLDRGDVAIDIGEGLEQTLGVVAEREAGRPRQGVERPPVLAGRVCCSTRSTRSGRLPLCRNDAYEASSPYSNLPQRREQYSPTTHMHANRPNTHSSPMDMKLTIAPMKSK